MLGKSGQEGVDGQSDLFVLVAESIDTAVGVDDGGVVSAAEMSADFFETVFGEMAGEIHADLSGESNAATASFSLEIA